MRNSLLIKMPVVGEMRIRHSGRVGPSSSRFKVNGDATIIYARNTVPPDTHREVVVLSEGIARELIIECFAFENGSPEHHIAPVKLLESSSHEETVLSSDRVHSRFG